MRHLECTVQDNNNKAAYLRCGTTIARGTMLQLMHSLLYQTTIASSLRWCHCRTLLDQKRAANRKAHSRYTVGLQKLQSSAEQVAGMQAELQALQPQLVRTVAEVESLMAVIAREKAEVVEPKVGTANGSIPVAAHVYYRWGGVCSRNMCDEGVHARAAGDWWCGGGM